MTYPLRLSLVFTFISLFGVAAAVAQEPLDRSADEQRHARLIQHVESFDYFIAPGRNGAPTAGEAFQAAASEPYDMLIADYYSGHKTIDAADVQAFHASGKRRDRLAIAYIDAGEFMRCCSNIDQADQASWFDAQGQLTAAAPRWFGPQNAGFNGLWVVRDWDPAWQTYVIGEIDKMIDLGFDGVFLDVLYNDSVWGPNGSAAGQAGVANYQESQKEFAQAIWNHIRHERHNARFIVITNYSGVLETNTPALTEGLRYSDAFMKESDYFDRYDEPAPWVGSTPIDEYFANRYTRFYAGMIQQHKVVLQQTYNLSFENESLMLQQSARYGYLLSNTSFPQDLIHIDALPYCNKEACWATGVNGQHVRYPRPDAEH